MSDQNETPTELSLLKQRARLMGLTFSNNISLEKLKAKIAAQLEGTPEEGEDADDAEADDQAELEALNAPVPAALQTELEAAPAAQPAPAVIKVSDLVREAAAAPQAPAPEPTHAPSGRKLTKAELFQQTRDRLVREETKLIRVRITNMDPKKKDLHGEIFSVGNKYIGTIKKFVPYGEATDNGYHLPKILVDDLRERKFQDIRTVKDPRTKVPIVQSKWVREFAIEVLPPLTTDELRDLAIAQAGANAID